MRLAPVLAIVSDNLYSDLSLLEATVGHARLVALPTKGVRSKVLSGVLQETALRSRLRHFSTQTPRGNYCIFRY
jgi:hypothetical protein